MSSHFLQFSTFLCDSPSSGLLAKVMSSKRMLSSSLGESPLNQILIKLPATKASFGCSCVCHHSASNTCDSAGPPNLSESQVPEQMYLSPSTAQRQRQQQQHKTKTIDFAKGTRTSVFPFERTYNLLLAISSLDPVTLKMPSDLMPWPRDTNA